MLSVFIGLQLLGSGQGVATIDRRQALFDDVSKRAVQYFWDQSHPLTGLTRDRSVNSAASESRTVASTAATGFALTALAIGTERGWLIREQALARAKLTLISLNNRVPKNHGWLLHWIDWGTGARVWNSEVSSIDSSICFAGVIVARQYFKDTQLNTMCDTLLNGVDWNWMRTNGGALPNSMTYSHGYVAESGWLSNRWSDYSEQLMLYVQGLGASTSVPAATWTGFVRNTVTYQGIQVITGGPLFLHQMSHGFINFANQRDSLNYDYWVATYRATKANRQYCITNPKGYAAYGKNFWGLTASDGPDGYDAFGAPGWGSDNGTIAPTCVAASVDYMPSEVASTLQNIRKVYPNSWGKYGFPNAINPHRNYVDPDVIGIDLGMAMCGIENRRDGFVHRQSASHPWIANGLARAGFSSLPFGSSRKNDVLRY